MRGTYKHYLHAVSKKKYLKELHSNLHSQTKESILADTNIPTWTKKYFIFDIDNLKIKAEEDERRSAGYLDPEQIANIMGDKSVKISKEETYEMFLYTGVGFKIPCKLELEVEYNDVILLMGDIIKVNTIAKKVTAETKNALLKDCHFIQRCTKREYVELVQVYLNKKHGIIETSVDYANPFRSLRIY